MTDVFSGDWLAGTFWYVPTVSLPAILAVNTRVPFTTSLTDQTDWRFDRFTGGYVTGISATNIGRGWSYMMMIGSIAPNRAVKISFSPLGAADPEDPTTQAITIGDGTIIGMEANASFLMQMTSGTAASSVTHWALMLQVTTDDPEWLSLPGYPESGVTDLKGLWTPIGHR